MPATPSRPGVSLRGPLGFRIIGALKLTNGLLMFVAWLGMFRLFKNGLTEEIDWAVRHFRLDPENRCFHMAIDWLSGLDQKHLRAIEAGAFFFALLHVGGGGGAVFGGPGGGDPTIIAPSPLLPFVVDEIFLKGHPLKILVLVVHLR